MADLTDTELDLMDDDIEACSYPLAPNDMQRMARELKRHRAAKAADAERIRAVVSTQVDRQWEIYHQGYHATRRETVDAIATRCAEQMASAAVRLPDRKEWDCERYDRGDTSEEDGYESSDYVDGWNDALDVVARTLGGNP